MKTLFEIDGKSILIKDLLEQLWPSSGDKVNWVHGDHVFVHFGYNKFILLHGEVARPMSMEFRKKSEEKLLKICFWLRQPVSLNFVLWNAYLLVANGFDFERIALHSNMELR